MTMLLFAMDTYEPRGGADDLIGVFASKLTDEQVFEAVLAQIDTAWLTEKLSPSSIEVNAVMLANGKADDRFFWKLRFAKSLEDEVFRFALLKTNHEKFGPCGLIPVTREPRTSATGHEYFEEYETLDPAKNNRR